MADDTVRMTAAVMVEARIKNGGVDGGGRACDSQSDGDGGGGDGDGARRVVHDGGGRGGGGGGNEAAAHVLIWRTRSEMS